MKVKILLLIVALSLALCSCGREMPEPSNVEKNIEPEQKNDMESGQNLKEKDSSGPKWSQEAFVKKVMQGTTNEEGGEDREDREDSTASTDISEAYRKTLALTDIPEAYQKILQAEQIKIDSAHKAGNSKYGYYAMGDINQDGIPELMLLTGSCAADESWKCYSYDGDTAYQVGEFSGGHSSLCNGPDGVYSLYAQMGYVEISKIIWEGGVGDIWTEIVYTSDSNDMDQDGYDALIETFGLKEIKKTEIPDQESFGATNIPKKNNARMTEFGMPPVEEGTYWEGGESPYCAMYCIKVSNGTNEGFDFEIFGRDHMDDEFSTVFRYHTAVYTAYNTAVYYGQNYTLTFRWTEPGYLSVDGFTERIPSDNILYNSDYLGVS